MEKGQIREVRLSGVRRRKRTKKGFVERDTEKEQVDG